MSKYFSMMWMIKVGKRFLRVDVVYDLRQWKSSEGKNKVTKETENYIMVWIKLIKLKNYIILP